MIMDWDDLIYTDGWFIDRMWQLKAMNPLFKCTVFAIPEKMNKESLLAAPSFVQLGVHGKHHETNYECAKWDFKTTHGWICACEETPYYARIFKAPGWQISRDARKAIQEYGWILADNPHYKKDRLPGERIYDWTEHGKEAWHGHINSTQGNGLLESWDKVVKMVKEAKEFKFISEVVQ